MNVSRELLSTERLLSIMLLTDVRTLNSKNREFGSILRLRHGLLSLLMELTVTFERHDNLDNFDSIFEQAATSELIPLCEQGTGIAQEKSPIDRGFYRGSLTNEVAPVSAGIIQGRIFSTADPIVTQVIETGRKPGTFPPLEIIRAWVQRKLGSGILTGLTSIGPRRPGQIRLSKAAARREAAGDAGPRNTPLNKAMNQAAYLIGRHIARFGIPGKFIFRDTFQQMQPSIQEAKGRITEKIAKAI